MQNTEANKKNYNISSNNNSPREVSAGVLIRPDGRFLLALRPKGKTWGGYWEFPGGKIESGETALDALKRELKEEIGIEVQQAYPWLKFGHLNFFRITRWNGEIKSLEGQEFSWEIAGNVQAMPLIPANYGVLNALNLSSVYAITNLAEMGELHFFHALQQALKQGLKPMIQIREKHLNSKQLPLFCDKLFKITKAYPDVKILLNSDHYKQSPELMKQFAFDGIHWTSQHLGQLQEKSSFKLNAGSCHNQAELKIAEKLGLDFVVLSPVNPTLSHPTTPHLGWQKFNDLISNYSIPTFALGGLNLNDIETSWKNHGHGVALQRQFWKI